MDDCCKKLLSNKQILAWIMKTTMKEYRGYSIQTIAERFIEGTPQIAKMCVDQDERGEDEPESIIGMKNEEVSLTEGKVTYDIHFLALVPRTGELVRMVINIEAQNDFYPGYPLIKRGIYYCSRMISSQKGTEFSGDDYGKIKKVYSVWICINPPKNRANTINEYSVDEKNLVGNVKEAVENYDLMTAIMICLGTEEDENYAGVLKLLGVLLSSEIGAEKKKRILSEEFHIKMTRELESEVTQMCNYSKGVVEKAIAKGLEKGLAKGLSEGRESAFLNSIRNLVTKLHLTAEQAMEILEIPENERKRYMSLIME